MKNKIRGILIVIIIILNFRGITFAQVHDSSAVKNIHTFNIYLINGYALSYNFFNTDKYYLRAGLDFSTNRSDLDNDGKSSYGSTTLTNNKTDGNSNSENFSIDFSPQIIFPVYTTEFGQAYLGGGPSIRYSTVNFAYNEQRLSETGIASSYSTSNSNKIYAAGVLVIGGIKALISDKISMFAETHLNGGIRWQKIEQSNTSIYNNEIQQISHSSEEGDGWFYDATFIRLGVTLSL